MKSAHQYQISALLWQQAGMSLHSAKREGSETPYLIKLFEHDYFAANQSLQIQKEQLLLQSLSDVEGVVSFVEQIEVSGQPALVFVQPPGKLLIEYLSEPWSYSDSRALSLNLLDVLGQLHSRQINFNNVNPYSLFWHPHTHQLTFIDFFQAHSFDQKLKVSPDAVLTSERLPYLSPEATGRMNRTVDYRSDFYSLGVILYQVITGQLPFSSDKQQELLHAHLAIKPLSPKALRNDLPEYYEGLTLKLLAKNADDRYRSVYGLQHDLKLCEQMSIEADPKPFELGQFDVPSQLQLPQKLYGREQQTQTLLMAFDQVLQSGSQLLLVSGRSGVGKSALINEIQKPIVAHKGTFVSGKFDQYNRGIPFEPVIHALNQFIQQQLSREASELESLKSRLLDEVGEALAVVFEVMPQLELVVGELPEPAPLPPAESQQRFNRVFLSFIRCIGHKEQALVIFLDDLQWADGASLGLIQQLLSEPESSHLMLLCAARDNEISHNPSLAKLLKKAREDGLPLVQLALDHLQKKDVEAMLMDTFSCDANALSQLTNLCWQKSLGNPFYLEQLLLALYEQRYIYFDSESGHWSWLLEPIANFAVSENVAQLMANKMVALGEPTLQVLQSAAVFGNEFSLLALRHITKLPHHELVERLLPALSKGYITALGVDIELLKVSREADDYDARFQFLHDQVRQAAYSSLPDQQRTQIHKDYGFWLFEQDTQTEHYLFESVNHLNRAKSLIEPEFIATLIKLNNKAANKAKSTTAYQSALSYVEKATTWLAFCTDASAQLKQEVELLSAECLFLTGQTDKALAMTKVALADTSEPMARAALYNQMLIVNSNLGHFEEAINNVGEAIKALGFEWPESDEQINALIDTELKKIDDYLSQNSPLSLLQLEPMTDDKVLLLSLLYASAWPAALNVNYPLSTLFVLKLVTLSIEFGNSSVSPFGYVNYGTMLTAQFGRYQQGYDFGKLAVELVESSNNLALKSKVYTMFGVTNSPWTVHLPENIKLLNKALESGIESGDMIFTSHSAFHILMLTQLSGLPLSRLEQACQQNYPILQRVGDVNVLEVYAILYQSVALWRGHSSTTEVWDHQNFDEAELVQQMEQQQHSLCLNYFHFNKMVQAYHFGRFEQALSMAEAAEQTLVFTFGWLSIAEHCFYHCLILAQLYPDASEQQQAEYLAKMQLCIDKMASWHQHCPSNFGHKYHLMLAEFARIQQGYDEAENCYEDAISSAEDFDFIMHQGLCYQLLGQCLLEKQRIRTAKLALAKAVEKYRVWGASALVEQLQQDFAELFKSDLGKAQTILTTSNRAEQPSDVDFDTLLSAAQSISGHIVEEQVINDLMTNIMELAGAEKAKLLLANEQGLYLAAKSDEHSQQVELLQPRPLSELENELPNTVINYVRRAHQQLVLANASAEGQFSHDPYIQMRRPKSVICAPVIQSNQLLGIIYLENNFLTGAFTAERLKALSVLATQAAVSLVNASLYQDMEQRVTERTEQLSIAKHKAEQATAAKSDFLAKMSHEIRTPLNAVIGLSQLTLKSQLHPEDRINLTKILGSSEALLGLINDILDFSKSEVGKMKLDRVSFCLDKVIQQAVAVVSLKAYEKGVELITYVSPSVPRFYLGDPLRLQQILTNLCSNAVKFTEQGSVSVVVSHIKNEDTVSLEFKVIDTGIGISEQQQDKLFQSFSQVDESITRRFGGSGLGLAICKQLTDMMGGDIYVQSQLGQGSTFTFTVKLEEEPHSKDVLKISKQQLSKLKVLVVDDVELSQTVVTAPLQNIGIETDVASDGLQALTKIRKAKAANAPYDLLFLDWKMPEMDGIELAKVLNAEMAESVPKIIMVSAFNKEEVKALASPLGITHFIEKPVSQSSLIDYLVAVVSGDNPSIDNFADNYKAMNLSAHKILLVEDNRLNQKVALGFLAETGAQVDVAVDGAEALAMLAQHKDYDFVLMDIQMPVMDGLTATKKAREELGIKIPIVAMTAHAMEGDSEKSKLAGMDEHITKPIDPELLYFTLNKYLTADMAAITDKQEIHSVIEEDDDMFLNLSALPDLDMKKALRNVRGNRSLLENMLKDFANLNIDFDIRVAKLVQQQEHASLHRQLHSLKSNAAYIGADEVSSLAIIFEKAVAIGDYEQDDLFKFARQVTRLAEKLNQQLQNQLPTAKNKELDYKTLREVYNRLVPLVQESNSTAEAVGNELMELCLGTELQASVDDIYLDLNNFDFDDAMTKLLALKPHITG